VKRRHLLFAPLFEQAGFAPAAFAQAPWKPAYRIAPPYEAFRPLIDNGTSPAMPAAPKPRAKVDHPWFADVTGTVLQSEQLARGVPYWTARLDPATGIDIYGNNGVSVADVDNDGLDEIFVCQPAGLPNKLYKWRGGQLIDITAAAGLALLDDTVCALFLDLRNLGRQDLIVMRGGGPLLFLNDGQGRFTLARDAFRFAQAPTGSFTGMAAADYDGDGRLDVYCCCYSFFQSEAQYRYPSPYHDAQNGPPNFLFRNRLQASGAGFFEDVTAATGLSANNNRFSFAPAWCDYDESGWPSLYVANDFGRNNLYRNRSGRFEDVAAAAGVEDMGPGMSAAWFDENGDGRPDLYVANMWTPTGQEAVKSFAGKDAEAYRRHTKGNSLYVNRGDGRFDEAGEQRGVERGRWAWGSDAFDFDNDGRAEILITCGMMTGERAPDLMGFFWNHVVQASPAGAERSAAYENAWNALNQFVREGYSWSGHEANIFYRRQGQKYADASAESGLDVALDSRAFAVTDIDGDGCLDVILKSRLGPQLTVFQNRRGFSRPRIGFKLQGTKSNRDAIGARVRVDGQTKWITAGSGYLAQHTKTLYFGLADSRAAAVEVTWPSGAVERFTALDAGALYRLVEGEPAPTRVKDLPDAAALRPTSVTGDNRQRLHDTWFVDPVPLPVRYPAGLVTLTAADLPDADTAAAFALFRRYLFEYRADLAWPLALLVDAQGRAVKIYGRVPTREQVAADLRAAPRPYPEEGFRVGLAQRDFFKLGAALASCGYGRFALPYLEEVLRRQPENGRALVLAGQIHREGKRLAEARRALEQALALDPASAEAWNELGGVEQAEGQDKKALECFGRALAAQPDLVYALLNAGQSASRLQAPAEAERHYRRAATLDAASGEAHNGLGLALAQLGRAAEAERSLRRALEVQPALGPAWNNLAVLLLQGKREAEAIQVLTQGIAQAPSEELLYLNLARVYVARGDRAEARRWMEQLLGVNPSSATARRALESLR